MTINTRDTYLPIQDVFVQIMNKLQEANVFLEQSRVVSLVFDELRNKYHLFQTSEMDEVKIFSSPQTGYCKTLLEQRLFNIHSFPT